METHEEKVSCHSFLCGTARMHLQMGCAVTVPLTQPECPHKVQNAPHNDTFYALQYSEMPSCVLLISSGWICTLMDSVTCSPKCQTLSGTVSQHQATAPPQLCRICSWAPALCETLNSSSWAQRKMLLVEDLPCLPVKSSCSTNPWHRSGEGRVREGRAQGKHGKINAMGACTELSSQGVFQWH